jgi:hypothetical protein
VACRRRTASPRPDVCSPLGTLQPRITHDGNADEDDSDGIARVHGMSNVQAEELVEYATPQLQAHDRKLTRPQVRLRCQGHVHEP